jgi:hypothetical protein
MPARILAIMLGRLMMSVEEAIDRYVDLIKKVFVKGPVMGHCTQLFETWLKSMIEQGTQDPDALMFDPRLKLECKTYAILLQII